MNSTSDRLPLTAGQQLVWLAQRLAPTSPAYNAAECVEIHGGLDVSSFEHAVRAAVAEADALNVCVVEEQGSTAQVRQSTTDWPFPVLDLSGESDPLAAAHRWMAADLAEPVDLTTGPLFGHALFVLGPERHLWYHRCHHIALDGYGFFLVAQRVAQLYTAPAGTGRWFGALRDVVEADHAYQNSEQRKLDGKFWQTRFADHPPTPSFTDRIAGPGGRMLRRSASLPEDVTVGLLRGRVNWAELMLAVVARQVRRRTGANEILLGCAVMGRLGSPAARTPAMIANVVPVRVPVLPGDDLLTVARSVGREMLAIRPHTRYRGEHVRRDLRLLGGERRLYGPVVNVLPFDYDLPFGKHSGSARGFARNLSTGPHGIEDIVINFHVRSNQPPELDLDANPRCYDETRLEELLDELATALVAAGRS